MFKGSSFRLGRVSGIDVKLDYSWFIIFVLITWSLAGHHFPSSHPGWPSLLYLVMSVATALLFFGSVLAHELAHSLISQAHGVGVHDITLFIFGGVARLNEEPKSAGGEFLMALAGPGTSLALGGLFGMAWLIGRNGSPQIHALAGWLASINVALALFNLIPGFPLDGGRVFRSVVWRFSGDRLHATRLAAQVGRFVAYGFMVWGIWQILSGEWANGLWIVFIGWFLESAATQSFQSALLQDLLAGHEVREAMTTATPFHELQFRGDALDTWEKFPDERRILRLQELEDNEPRVLIPEIERGSTNQDDSKLLSATGALWARLRSVAPDEDLSVAFQRMTAEDVNQLPVVEGGRLVGLLRRDMLPQFFRAHSRG